MKQASHSANGITGRDAAYEAVLSVLTGRGFVADKLREIRRSDSLDARDSAFAGQIARGTIRHLITIERVLARVAKLDEKQIEPPLRTILAIGAYQIIWMDRVPVFAAVDSAVEQTRRVMGKRVTGMANAVLRNLVRAIADRRTPWQRLNPLHVRVDRDAACAFSFPVLPLPDGETGLIEHLAVATGERTEYFAKLVDRCGFDQAEAIGYARQAVPATTLRRHMIALTAEEFEQRVRATFGDRAEIIAGGASLPPDVSVVDTDLFRDGAAYVQDHTAYEAARNVNARPGARVLDLCAAPGGKSITIAMQMQGRGTIVACDVDESRVALIRQNIERMKLANIETRVIKMDTPPRLSLEELGGEPFDAAIVDAPCSNTGVVSRRPEARLGLTGKKLRSLVRLQAQLIRRAAACVRPGGHMVYSTCSLEREEDEGIVESFLAECNDWRQLSATTHWPRWGQALCDYRDGGFVAVLKRSAEA